jgi:Tol biopolymer transport system component
MIDHGKIVFASGYRTNFDIWSLQLETGELFQLTTGENLNDFPKWSPDGSRIAYISTQDDMVSSLWVMDSNGANKRRLTNHIHCQQPAWSPDGRSIIFISNSDNPQTLDIAALNLDSGEIESIYRCGGMESEPSWSPDGRFIVFAAPESVNQSGISSRNTDIYELEVATGKVARLTSSPAKDFCPRYSPDGSKIAFISHRNSRTDTEYQALTQQISASIKAGDMQSVNSAIRKLQALEQDSDIWLMDRCGSDQRAITDNDDTELGISWAPDGSALIYTCASKGLGDTERLKIIDVNSGLSKPVEFDRSPLEAEIGASGALNRTFVQKLFPDMLERLMVNRSFWGEERNPDWTNS